MKQSESSARKRRVRLKKEHTTKIEMNMTDDRTIEVEVTEEDLEQMKAEGFSDEDLPEIGIKRYRPSRHILKDKGKVTLLIDSEVLEHFEKRAEKEDVASCQIQINEELRRIMERDRAKDAKEKITA